MWLFPQKQSLKHSRRGVATTGPEAMQLLQCCDHDPSAWGYPRAEATHRNHHAGQVRLNVEWSGYHAGGSRWSGLCAIPDTSMVVYGGGYACVSEYQNMHSAMGAPLQHKEDRATRF